MPKRFYYIWNYVQWGGAQVLFFGLMKEAKKYGEVIVILPSDSNEQLLKFLRKINVKFDFVDSFTDSDPALTFTRKLERHWNKIKSEIKYFQHIRKLNLKESIIHAEFAPWQSFAILYLLAHRTNVFVTMHNSIFTVQKWRRLTWSFKLKLLTNLRKFHLFTANKHTKKSLGSLLSKEAIDKIEVIYANINAVEINEALKFAIDVDELRRFYGIPEEKFLVFCVGQFIDRKGRWIFLEAAKKLLEIYDDLAFVWISNSKPDAIDLAKAESYNLGDNFTLVTSDQIGTEHIDLFKLLRLADVFALPSYWEGLPISIIEAMALGVPTISTDVNAIPEAIKHLETGILINPGSVEELITAIEQLKNDDDLRKRLSIRGREFALENFDEKAVAEIALKEYIKAYRNR